MHTIPSAFLRGTLAIECLAVISLGYSEKKASSRFGPKSINAITSVISPLVMTLLFKLGTLSTEKTYIPGIPFLFAAFLLIVIIYPLLKSMVKEAFVVDSTPA